MALRWPFSENSSQWPREKISTQSELSSCYYPVNPDAVFGERIRLFGAYYLAYIFLISVLEQTGTKVLRKSVRNHT